MVDDPASARARLHELKTLGVRISMDDFGTGYSSLASLQDLPLDILKIDKLFVDHVAEDPRRTAFAQAIIRMGKTLGLGLIAEGVETADQAERLQSLGCRFAQGFYFSRPVPPDEIQQMLLASHAIRVDGRALDPARQRRQDPACAGCAGARDTLRADDERTAHGRSPEVRRSRRCGARMSGVSLLEHVERAEILAHLLHPARTGDDRRDMRVGRAPCDRRAARG